MRVGLGSLFRVPLISQVDDGPSTVGVVRRGHSGVSVLSESLSGVVSKGGAVTFGPTEGRKRRKRRAKVREEKEMGLLCLLATWGGTEQ